MVYKSCGIPLEGFDMWMMGAPLPGENVHLCICIYTQFSGLNLFFTKQSHREAGPGHFYRKRKAHCVGKCMPTPPGFLLIGKISGLF